VEIVENVKQLKIIQTNFAIQVVSIERIVNEFM
jgi:hypothetical protein